MLTRVIHSFIHSLRDYSYFPLVSLPFSLPPLCLLPFPLFSLPSSLPPSLSSRSYYLSAFYLLGPIGTKLYLLRNSQCGFKRNSLDHFKVQLFLFYSLSKRGLKNIIGIVLTWQSLSPNVFFEILARREQFL